MKCQRCGAELLDTDTFCVKCGQKVGEPARCPVCGEILREGTKFCHKCGAAVNNEDTEPHDEEIPVTPQKTIDIPFDVIEKSIIMEAEQAVVKRDFSEAEARLERERRGEKPEYPEEENPETARNTERKEEKNLEGQAGAFVGNAASQNVQMGTDTAIDSMRELLYKAGKISKVGFEQSKGNLFEYIEAAKLQTNMANCGERFDRNPVTDLAAGRGGYGGHTAPDDFRMQRNGRIVGQGQAKYNNSAWRAAQNFVDPKYTDMQRIAPTDQMADIESCLHKMAENGEISKTAYENAVSNLMKKGLTDPSTGIAL